MSDVENSETGTAAKKGRGGFTEAERSAMKQRAKELKAAKADTEPDVLAKIAEMPEPDRGLAEQVHAIVKAYAPELKPKLWYGMPSYAKDGTIICFFQDAKKFKARYATLGFSDAANLDDGAMWATSYSLTTITPDIEARIGELIKQAAG